MRPKVHLALVSAQAVPNITPALDPDFQPEEVVLLVSPDMGRRAEWLGQVLRGRGVRVSSWSIDDAWDVAHVSERVWELLERRQGDDLALNATGGTKPMSIAAYEAFRDWGRPIFYVHPEKDRVIWMHPSGTEDFELADRINLRDFLLAYGATLPGLPSNGRTTPALRRLTDDLVEAIDRWARPLRTLNWLASGAANPRLRSTEISPETLADEDFLDLSDRFEAERLLRLDGNRLVFADELARFFVNGGWLEQHVFELLSGMRGEYRVIQDLGRGLEVVRQAERGSVRNELDVAFLADNRLYIVECKTRQWSRSGPDGPGAEALYKLDTLKDLLGGLQAKAMLVSYQKLLPHDRTRAQDLGIAVCAGGQLQHLRARLGEWIGAET